MIIKCSQCSQKNRVPAARLGEHPTCGSCKEALAVTGTPRSVKPAELDDLIAHSELPVLVDYWAPWCGPCRAVAPEVEKLAARRRDVVVVKLNTEDHPQIAAREGIQGIPMFAVYKNGGRVASQAGYMKSEQLESALGI